MKFVAGIFFIIFDALLFLAAVGFTIAAIWSLNGTFANQAGNTAALAFVLMIPVTPTASILFSEGLQERRQDRLRVDRNRRVF